MRGEHLAARSCPVGKDIRGGCPSSARVSPQFISSVVVVFVVAVFVVVVFVVKLGKTSAVVALFQQGISLVH